MPWVKFTRDFPWSPPERHGNVTIAYQAGMTELVSQACAAAAIGAGAGAPARNPASLSGARASYGRAASNRGARWKRSAVQASQPSAPRADEVSGAGG